MRVMLQDIELFVKYSYYLFVLRHDENKDHKNKSKQG